MALCRLHVVQNFPDIVIFFIVPVILKVWLFLYKIEIVSSPLLPGDLGYLLIIHSFKK